MENNARMAYLRVAEIEHNDDEAFKPIRDKGVNLNAIITAKRAELQGLVEQANANAKAGIAYLEQFIPEKYRTAEITRQEPGKSA